MAAPSAPAASYGATTDTDRAAAPAAAPPAQDAVKARIMGHMNKDHSLSLFDYLNYYLHRDFDPDHPQSHVEMVDITNTSVTLKYSHKDSPNEQVAIIPINPPMDSLRDARGALVDMAREAATARGFATHRISEFVAPWASKSALHDILVFATVLVAIVPPLRSAVFGSIGGLLGIPADGGPFFGGIVSFLEKFPLLPAIITYVGHTAEAFFILKPQVTKYRVPYPQRTYWYLANFFEGFPALQRFNRLVRKVEGQH